MCGQLLQILNADILNANLLANHAPVDAVTGAAKLGMASELRTT